MCYVVKGLFHTCVGQWLSSSVIEGSVDSTQGCCVYVCVCVCVCVRVFLFVCVMFHIHLGRYL